MNPPDVGSFTACARDQTRQYLTTLREKFAQTIPLIENAYHHTEDLIAPSLSRAK
jgi:hypothetical protein